VHLTRQLFIRTHSGRTEVMVVIDRFRICFAGSLLVDDAGVTTKST